MLSVEDHPRRVLLGLLPKECDILCTNPMFGTYSGKNRWHGLKLIYERTLIYGVIFVPTNKISRQMRKTYADSYDDKDP